MEFDVVSILNFSKKIPVSSRTATVFDSLFRVARYMGTTMVAAISSGPIMVITIKERFLTRVRYSRWMIRKIFFISVLSVLRYLLRCFLCNCLDKNIIHAGNLLVDRIDGHMWQQDADQVIWTGIRRQFNTGMAVIRIPAL